MLAPRSTAKHSSPPVLALSIPAISLLALARRPSSSPLRRVLLVPGYCSHPTRSFPPSPRRPAPVPGLPWTAVRQRDAAACIACVSCRRPYHRRPQRARAAVVVLLHTLTTHARPRPTAPAPQTDSLWPVRRAAFCRRHRTQNGAVNAPASHSLRSVPAPVTHRPPRPHVRAPSLVAALCSNVRHARCVGNPLF